MKTNLLKIISANTALLFLLMNVAAFAQGSATVSVKPSSLDFGSVEFESGKTLPVEVTNTSNKPIRIGSANANNSFAFTIPQNSQPLNPGEKRIVNFIATPRTTNPVTATGIITAGFANESLHKVAEVTLKVTGVDPFFRFNLKMANVGFNDIVKVQVTGDPIISQLNCVVPNDHDPFFGCDMRLRKNAQISLQSNSPNFQGFNSGTGAASVCSGKSPCTFTLTANSTVTAPFGVTTTASPGNGKKKVSIQLALATPGASIQLTTPQASIRQADVAGTQSLEVSPGTKATIIVTPAAGFDFRGLGVTTSDSEAKACGGNKTTCTFTVNADAAFNAVFLPNPSQKKK